MIDEYPIKVLKYRNTGQFLGYSNNIWTQINILTEDFSKSSLTKGFTVAKNAKLKEIVFLFQ